MQITDFTGMKEKNDPIEEFQGEFRWLSNFMPVTIVLDGVTFPSVEHAYVSSKKDDKEWIEICSKGGLTSAQIKNMGKGITTIKNVVVMTECLRQKFNQEPYKTKLIETGDRYIQEGNRWNDTFWGFCLKTNTGENNLGKIIMEIRDELKALINEETNL